MPVVRLLASLLQSEGQEMSAELSTAIAGLLVAITSLIWSYIASRRATTALRAITGPPDAEIGHLMAQHTAAYNRRVGRTYGNENTS